MSLKSLKVQARILLVLGLLSLFFGVVGIVSDLASDGQIFSLFALSVLCFLLTFMVFGETKDQENESHNDPA